MYKRQHHIIINEPEGFMSVDGNKQPVHIKYQSQLTGAVADEILLNGNCKLTTYFESSNYHKVFLKGILDVYNKVTGEMHDRCPIT